MDSRQQRDSLFRQGKSLEAGCPRQKHTGATAFRGRGRHHAGGLALPVRAGVSSGLRSQFPGLQYLARRGLCSRRAGLRAACRLYLLHENGLHPQLSPDGRRVAFASDRSGGWEIWLADPDGSNAVQLTSMGADSGAPCWSPDGERIVFQSNPEGQFDVYVIRAAGGKPRNLTSHPATDWRPSFSRDGHWIYFTSNRTGQRQIWKVPASGGDALQVTNNVAFAAFESPDGAYLYYNQTMETPSPLWRQPVSGGAPVKVLDGVVQSRLHCARRRHLLYRPALG